MTTGPPILPPKSLAIWEGLVTAPKGRALRAAFWWYQNAEPCTVFEPLFEVVVTSPGSPNSAGLPTPCTFISAMDSAEGKAFLSGELPLTLVMEIPSTLNCDCDC